MSIVEGRGFGRDGGVYVSEAGEVRVVDFLGFGV